MGGPPLSQHRIKKAGTVRGLELHLEQKADAGSKMAPCPAGSDANALIGDAGLQPCRPTLVK